MQNRCSKLRVPLFYKALFIKGLGGITSVFINGKQIIYSAVFISVLEEKAEEEERARSGEKGVEGQRVEVKVWSRTCCFYVRILGEGLTEVYHLP